MPRRVFALALSAALLLFGVIPPGIASASVLRSFAVRYSSNQPGDITMASNTLETCPASALCTTALNGTATGANLNDNNYAMVFVDVDADPTTFDSSRADLSLPAGATVLFAGLYWAATTVGTTAPPTVASKGSVLFQVPGGAYQTITSTQTDSDPASPNSYQGFADVTSLVLAAGGGTYAVANVQAATGANMDAGWDLVVAYGDPSKPARNLTVFDGLAVINSPAAPVDISVSGFTTPPSGAVNTKLGIFGMDGDLGSTGDALSLNGTVLSNGLNPPDNFWNSTISNLGTSVTSRSPNDINTLGLDADIVSANGVLANGATSATIHLTTGGETYWPGVVTFVTDLYAPKIAPTKTVTDLNGGTVQRGDTLEYTVDAANTGEDAAGGVVVTDPIPAHTSYVPGSLVVLTGPNAGAKSDSSGNDQAEFDGGSDAVVFRLGTGANGTSGGTLAAVGHPNDQSSFRFRVKIDSTAPADTTISNLAEADYFGVTLGPTIPFNGTASAPTTTTIADADLAISKTIDDPDPSIGDLVTYTIGVSNNGPASSAATVVSDPVPAGTTFVAASTTSGTYVSSSGAWTIGSLLPGASASLTLQVRVTAAGPLTNTATASSDTPDPNPANNTATVTTASGLADLVVTKVASILSAPVGSNVTFTIGLHNSGPDTATTIRLSDLLPAGLSFVSATPSVGTYTSGTGSWAIASLASGASASLALVAKVTDSGSTTNVAQVVSLDQVDPDPSNSMASATVDGLTADLGLTKTVNNASPSVGTAIIYTVTVTNHGPAAAAGTVVSDPIPSGLAFTSATTSTGSYSAVTGSWSVGTLASGASATLAIHVTVTSSAHITNTATVSSSVPDPDPANNQASVTVPNLVADLSLTKSVAPPATPIGSSVVYTLTLANAGPAAATNIAVHELLPAGLAFVSSTPSTGTYDPSTGAWLLPTVASGSSATLDLTATVLASGPITNTAQISGLDQSDPTSANGSASATVTGEAADLSVTKAADNPTPSLGGTVAFTVKVANSGPDAAPAVELTDLLPSGLSFVADTATLGSYTAGSGVWDVGTIPAGTTATLVITATVTGVGTIRNIAEVTASGLPDPNSTPGNGVVGEDDEAIATLTVAAAADLSLTKTATPTAAVVGATITFHVGLHNSGPSTATGVVIADLLPAGLALVSAMPTVGSYDTGTGEWTVPSVAASGDAELVIVATVTATGAGTNTAEVTASDQFDPDSTPGNHDPAEDDQASASFTRRLPSADLSLTKSVSPSVVRIGSNAVFTLIASNAGPDSATGVSVRDVLGAGFSFVSATGTGSYNSTTGIWTIGTIASGASATLHLTARMTAVGPATNTAEVFTSDQPDPNSTPGNGVLGENDEATAGLTVSPGPTPPVTANGSPIVPAAPQSPSGLLLFAGLLTAFAAAAGLFYRSRRADSQAGRRQPRPYMGAHRRR